MITRIIIVFLCFLFLLHSFAYALLWDFNKAEQIKDWKIISGKCEIDKDKTLMLSEGGGEALAIVGESNWTDYTITTKARLTQPGSFNNIAIVFRVSDDGTSEYIFMLEGGRQQAEWWKKVAGTYTELKTKPLEIDKKGWFNIKVVVKDKNFDGYYNNELISSIQDSDLKNGKVGVRVYGCTSNIDDFDVNGPGIPLTAVEFNDKISITWGKIKDQ